MSITYHERPGVYAAFETHSTSATGSGTAIVAAVGLCSKDAGLYTLTSANDCADFEEASALRGMLELLYANGAGTVVACPVAQDTQEDYAAAFALVLAEKKATLLVTDAVQQAQQLALKSELESAAAQKGECIALCGMDADTVEALTARAQVLNSPRMVLVGPRCYADTGTAASSYAGPAALAGLLSAQTDPALPVHGLGLENLSGVAENYTETQIDTLVRGGVTPLELCGTVSAIRTVTTKTTTAGTADTTYRELSTMRIIDELLPAIRTSLSAKFARAKNNAATRASIASQVTVELENRVARQVIDSYDNLRVSADPEDPTVCVVRFGFTVTHGLCRIYLTAQISV